MEIKAKWLLMVTLFWNVPSCRHCYFKNIFEKFIFLNQCLPVSALRDVTIQNWFTQFIGFHPFLCSFDQKIIEHNAHACVAYRI